MHHDIPLITTIVAGLVLAFGYAVCWLYAVIGLAVKDTQAAQFLGFAPVLPLIFLSDAIVPVDSLPPGLEAFARNQPVTITTKAVRALAAGVPAFDWVWVSLAWIVAVLGASLVLARRLTSTAVS